MRKPPYLLRHRLSWLFTSLACIALSGVFLAACQDGLTPTPVSAPTPTTQSLPPGTVETGATPVQTMSSQTPTSTAPLPSPTGAKSPPAFLYLNGGVLFEQAGSGVPLIRPDISGLGEVLAATILKEEVLVVHSAGLERVMLSDGSATPVQRFDAPVRSGLLVPSADRTQAVYQIASDETTARQGVVTRIGLYQSGGTSREVLTLPGNNLVVGLTRDSQGIYLVPRGQDPAFGMIQLVAVANGEIVSELPVEGYGGAVLSPDARYIVTLAQRASSSDTPAENVLQLYDPAAQPVVPRTVMLPKSASYVSSMLWSRSGNLLYIVVRAGDRNFPGESYGLWGLDVASGAVSLLAGADRTGDQHELEAISPDGGWLLLRHANEDQANIMQLETGETTALTLPRSAIVAGWR